MPTPLELKGPDNLETVRAFFDRVLNSGDIDALPSFVRTDVTVPQSPAGIEGMRRLLLELSKAFSRPEYKIVDATSDGTKIAVRFAGKATHTGRYLGIPATDRVLKVWGVMIFKFEDGAISELWSLIDARDILSQLRYQSF